jgi:hypothetical protein
MNLIMSLLLNRIDDEGHIVRLVGQVITVSIETVKLVNELAQVVKVEDWLGEIVSNAIN